MPEKTEYTPGLSAFTEHKVVKPLKCQKLVLDANKSNKDEKSFHSVFSDTLHLDSSRTSDDDIFDESKSMAHFNILHIPSLDLV